MTKQLCNGLKVSGQYYGKAFTGIVMEYRHHSVRDNLIIVTVSLYEPLQIYGVTRDSILIDYYTNGEVNPHACFD